MAKPTTVPLWATGAAAIVAPTTGKQGIGWTSAEKMPAEYANFLSYWCGQWLAYLNAGNMDGAFTFNNTVQVTGILTALDKVYATTGYYGAAGAKALLPNGLSTTTISFSTDVVVPIPTYLSVAATGASGYVRTAGSWLLAVNAGSDYIYYPIIGLQAGDVITQYNLGITKNDTTSNLTALLVSSTTTDSSASAGCTTTLSSGPQLIGESGLTVTTAGSTQYYIRVQPGTGVTPSADRIGNVSVRFHRP